MDKPPSELKSGMTKHPQLLRNVRMATKWIRARAAGTAKRFATKRLNSATTAVSCFAPPGPNLWFASWSKGEMRIRQESGGPASRFGGKRYGVDVLNIALNLGSRRTTAGCLATLKHMKAANHAILARFVWRLLH